MLLLFKEFLVGGISHSSESVVQLRAATAGLSSSSRGGGTAAATYDNKDPNMKNNTFVLGVFF